MSIKHLLIEREREKEKRRRERERVVHERDDGMDRKARGAARAKGNYR